MILKKKFKLICLIILITSNLLVFLIINTSPFFSANNHVCEKKVFFKTPFENLSGNIADRIIDEAIFLVEGPVTLTRSSNNSLIIRANKKMNACDEGLAILESLVKIESEILLQTLKMQINQNSLALQPDPRDLTTYEMIKENKIKLISLLVKNTVDGPINNTFYTKIIFLIMNVFLIMFLFALSFVLKKNQSFLKFLIKR